MNTVQDLHTPEYIEALLKATLIHRNNREIIEKFVLDLNELSGYNAAVREVNRIEATL